RKELEGSNNGGVSEIEGKIREIEREFVYRNGGLILKIYSELKDSDKYAHADDIIQQGRLAIVTTLRKFDLDKIGGNKKFSTYAWWWIRQSMKRYLRENRSVIHIPGNRHDNLRDLKLELPLTEKAVRARCEELGYKEHKTQGILAAFRAGWQKSLDEEPDNCKNGHQKLSNNNWKTTRKRVENKLLAIEISKKILKYYKGENIRDFGVFMLRSGVLGCDTTLREVGKIFDISGERVNQIIAGVPKKVASGNISRLDISDISDKELTRNLTDWCEIPYSLSKNLSEREYILVCLRFGIAFSSPCPLSEIAKTLETSTEQIEQELSTAIKKLEVLLIDDVHTNMEISISEYLLNRMENNTE
ncbi:sigma-70 family RNA polymerase sigma factor, partial [bacterium]|nr:sigma-70 family RNA polymerase sigma factor [bacterium]